NGGGVPVATLDIVFHDLLEFLSNRVALQGDRALAIDEDRSGRNFASARKADADVGMTAFARTIDHAAHYGHVHGFNAGIACLPHGHLPTQEGLYAVGQLLEEGAAGAPATRAGHHHGGECPQAHALEDLLSHDHFATAIAAGFGCQGNAD